MKVKILSDQKDLRSPKQLVIRMNTDVSVPSNQAVEINYSNDFFQKHGLLRWVSELNRVPQGTEIRLTWPIYSIRTPHIMPSQATEIGASQDTPSQGRTAREQGEASLWILKNRLPSDSFSKTG